MPQVGNQFVQIIFSRRFTLPDVEQGLAQQGKPKPRMVLKAGLERRDVDAFGIGGGSQIFRLASPTFGKAIADTEYRPLVVVVQMRQRTCVGEFFAYGFGFAAGNNVFVANQGMEIVGIPLAVVWQQIHVLFL